MTAAAPDDEIRVHEFLKLEYTTLSGELIKRVEFRQRLLEIAVVSAGAVLALNLTWDQYPLILLAYPILVMFLGLGWLHHDQRLQKLATYIRMQIEPAFRRPSNTEENPVGYETWLDQDRARQEGRIGGIGQHRGVPDESGIGFRRRVFHRGSRQD
jgi:hypothetical protein